MAQLKEQNKSPETDLKEMEIYKIPNKELKIATLKKHNKLNNNKKRQLNKIRRMVN